MLLSLLPYHRDYRCVPPHPAFYVSDGDLNLGLAFVKQAFYQPSHFKVPISSLILWFLELKLRPGAFYPRTQQWIYTPTFFLFCLFRIWSHYTALVYITLTADQKVSELMVLLPQPPE